MDAIQGIGKADSWLKGLSRYLLYFIGGLLVILGLYIFSGSFNQTGTSEEIEKRKKDRSGSYIILIIGSILILCGYLAGQQVERVQSSSGLSTLAGLSALSNLLK